MAAKTDRNMSMMDDRMRGSNYSELGRKYGISVSRVIQILRRIEQKRNNKRWRLTFFKCEMNSKGDGLKCHEQCDHCSKQPEKYFSRFEYRAQENVY